MEVIIVNENIASNNVFWLKLIRSIYESFSIQYVLNKGKKYMNCTNIWHNTCDQREKFENNGIKISHKDHECTWYWNKEWNIKSKINKRQVGLDEIKYIFDGKFEFDESSFEDSWEEFISEEFNEDDDNEDDNDKDDKVKYNELKKEIKQIMLLIEKNKTNGESEIKFVFDRKIKIYNPCGINDNHRGSDNMIIKLPFESEINFENEFTLEELIVGCQTIKSHKFDLWYELFCGAKCEIVDIGYKINLQFDHES